MKEGSNREITKFVCILLPVLSCQAHQWPSPHPLVIHSQVSCSQEQQKPKTVRGKSQRGFAIQFNCKNFKKLRKNVENHLVKTLKKFKIL